MIFGKMNPGLVVDFSQEEEVVADDVHAFRL